MLFWVADRDQGVVSVFVLLLLFFVNVYGEFFCVDCMSFGLRFRFATAPRGQFNLKTDLAPKVRGVSTYFPTLRIDCAVSVTHRDKGCFLVLVFGS